MPIGALSRASWSDCGRSEFDLVVPLRQKGIYSSKNPISPSILQKVFRQNYWALRTNPLLEMHLQALEHLFFNAFDVGESAPTSDVAVFRSTLNLNDKFFHQPRLVPVFFPEMLFANIRRLFLPIIGS